MSDADSDFPFCTVRTCSLYKDNATAHNINWSWAFLAFLLQPLFASMLSIRSCSHWFTVPMGTFWQGRPAALFNRQVAPGVPFTSFPGVIPSFYNLSTSSLRCSAPWWKSHLAVSERARQRCRRICRCAKTRPRRSDQELFASSPTRHFPGSAGGKFISPFAAIISYEPILL